MGLWVLINAPWYYSPDLNPIEQVFAKLKALLRKAAARTRDALWDTIGRLLPAFSPEECRNYIENSGRSEEHTSELQSLMRISYAVFCLKKKQTLKQIHHINTYTT